MWMTPQKEITCEQQNVSVTSSYCNNKLMQHGDHSICSSTRVRPQRHRVVAWEGKRDRCREYCRVKRQLTTSTQHAPPLWPRVTTSSFVLGAKHVTLVACKGDCTCRTVLARHIDCIKKHEVAAVQGLGQPHGSRDVFAKLLKTQS